tara:strand:- start:62 stop:1024 length:963 start_codon:yes stop_codon:yes gene_type:complete
METSPISFCAGEGANVSSKEIKQHILSTLDKKYGINLRYNHACILNDKSLNFLNNPHLISIKTTGTNYFLFITKYNNINYCFYIDRKIKQGYTCPRIISVKYRFDETVFNDTLLDGEIVKDKHDNWMFLISDMIVCEGQNIRKTPIEKRFTRLYSMFTDKLVPDKQMDICPMVIKRLFTYSEYSSLLTTFIPKLTYGIRGLYFNSINPKHRNQLFLYPKNQEKLVAKPKNNSNIIKSILKTFELRKTIQPEIYDLYCLNGTEIVKFETARVSTLRISKLLTKLFDTNESVFVDCKFNSNFNKWEPQVASDRTKLIDIKKI